MITLNRLVLGACTLAGCAFFAWTVWLLPNVFGVALGAFLGWCIAYLPTWFVRVDWLEE